MYCQLTLHERHRLECWRGAKPKRKFPSSIRPYCSSLLPKKPAVGTMKKPWRRSHDTARGPSRKKHVRLLQGHQDKPPSMYMNFHVRLLRLHVLSFLLLSPKRIQNTAQKLQMKGNEGPAQKRAFKTGNINFKGRVFRLNRLFKITLFIGRV